MDPPTHPAPTSGHDQPFDPAETSPLAKPESDGWPEATTPESGHMTESQLDALENQKLESDAMWMGIQTRQETAEVRQEAKDCITGINGHNVVEDPTVSSTPAPADLGAWQPKTYTPLEIHKHIHALQVQLAKLSSCLADCPADTPLSPPQTTFTSPNPDEDQPSTISAQADQNRLQWSQSCCAELEKENTVLRRNIRIQSTNIARLQEDLVQLQAFKPRTVKGFRGINPELVSDLASELICGTKHTSDIASSLFDLVEAAHWPKKEGHPMVRLDAVEGVLDVTLGRVKALEEKQASGGIAETKGESTYGGSQVGKGEFQLDHQFTLGEDDCGVGFDSAEYDEGPSGEDQKVEDKNLGEGHAVTHESMKSKSEAASSLEASAIPKSPKRKHHKHRHSLSADGKPKVAQKSSEDEVQRRRDEFEGWNAAGERVYR